MVGRYCVDQAMGAVNAVAGCMGHNIRGANYRAYMNMYKTLYIGCMNNQEASLAPSRSEDY